MSNISPGDVLYLNDPTNVLHGTRVQVVAISPLLPNPIRAKSLVWKRYDCWHREEQLSVVPMPDVEIDVSHPIARQVQEKVGRKKLLRCVSCEFKGQVFVNDGVMKCPRCGMAHMA